jgi:hypothetical protein
MLELALDVRYNRWKCYCLGCYVSKERFGYCLSHKSSNRVRYSPSTEEAGGTTTVVGGSGKHRRT